MKTIPTAKNDRNQSTALLWTPLPECQQELLSGGAPKLSGGGSGGSNSGGGSGGSGTGGIISPSDQTNSSPDAALSICLSFT